MANSAFLVSSFFLFFFSLLFSHFGSSNGFCIIQDRYVLDPWNSQKRLIFYPQGALHLMENTQ